MKTNVILNSCDRDLFGITIRQNTKEQFLSITDLQKSYDKARWEHGWSDRRVNDVLSYNSTKERLYFLLYERKIIKTPQDVFMKIVEKEGITKVLKGLGVYKTSGKGSDKQVMADPYIWTMIALEMNPLIYAKVVMWMADTLILDRIEAGNEYLPMNSAIKSIILNPDYKTYAISINEKVFGFHKSGMRNICSARELKKISNIEKFIINAISMGFLKTEEDIINSIKNIKI